RPLGGDDLKAFAQTLRGGEIGRREHLGRRNALPALKPDPFTPHDVRERVANGPEAGLQILGEVSLAQFRNRSENLLIRPVAVSIQRSDRRELHAEPPFWL